MQNDDTIVAISTAQGVGGIGIVRISGLEAFQIAQKIYIGKTKFENISAHSIKHGKIIDPLTGLTLDEILLTKLVKPKSFTREDTIEINCHGGIVILKNILELIIRMGARLAEPGEFTRRAFLNGRIDLSQAEAVIDVINSKTKESARAAVEQLEGRISKEVNFVRSKLIQLMGHIEVTVDYPEHDIEEITGEKVYREIKEIREKLNTIIKGFEKGRIIRDGIKVVIAGRPNVGKSSLLNALAGKSKAIVTDIPGTTRDIIEEYININGIPVQIIDTAGIRDTTDKVEMIGVEKAKKEVLSADLTIIIIDASSGILKEDLEIFKHCEEKKIIYLVNKVDLVDEMALSVILKQLQRECSREEEEDKLFIAKDSYTPSFKSNILCISLKEQSGIEELENEITGLFFNGEVKANNEVLITNVRHKSLIDKAMEAIDEACIAYENHMPLDCISIDIKNSAEYLGQITGESVNEDIMHEIFSKFCVGK